MMYGLFVIFGVLLWSSISKTFFLPSLWTLEIAQFAMVAYYILGGPFSLQIGANVRLDLRFLGWIWGSKARCGVQGWICGSKARCEAPGIDLRLQGWI